MTQNMSSIVPIDDLKLGMYVLDVKCKNRFFKIKTKGLVKSKSVITQLKKQGVTSLVIRKESPEKKETIDKEIPLQEKEIKPLNKKICY